MGERNVEDGRLINGSPDDDDVRPGLPWPGDADRDGDDDGNVDETAMGHGPSLSFLAGGWGSQVSRDTSEPQAIDDAA